MDRLWRHTHYRFQLPQTHQDRGNNHVPRRLDESIGPFGRRGVLYTPLIQIAFLHVENCNLRCLQRLTSQYRNRSFLPECGVLPLKGEATGALQSSTLQQKNDWNTPLKFMAVTLGLSKATL